MLKFWDFLGSIRLTFWLLISGSTALLTGSYYTNAHFSFFSSLSTTRIQEWLAQNLFSQPGIVWWIPLLLIIMGLLAVNILVCAVQRIIQIIPHRGRSTGLQFFHKLTPSLIHLIFSVVLLGHLITFTTGQWHRTPIKEGMTVTIDGSPLPFTVTSVNHTHYPEATPMRNRILQTRVEMRDSIGHQLSLEFLRPASINSHHLYLDMTKKRFAAQKTQIGFDRPVDENCNKAHVYHSAKQRDDEQKLLLLTVKDPGLYPICVGLFVILILMIWYFYYPHLNGRPLFRPKTVQKISLKYQDKTH